MSDVEGLFGYALGGRSYRNSQYNEAVQNSGSRTSTMKGGAGLIWGTNEGFGRDLRF